MKKTYLIREVTTNDAEALITYSKIIGGETNYLTFGKDGIPIDAETETKLLQSYAKDSQKAMWCAVNPQNEIIALCNFDVETNQRMAHRATFGISVQKQYWHQGIATALMRQIMTHAATLPHISIITLEVICENIHAIHLYERFRFQISGCMHQYFLIDGTYYDAYIMECDLRKGVPQ